jgi:hypothetical protein
VEVVTYLYCVLTTGATDPRRLVGIAGAPVRSLIVDRARSLEAWVASTPESAFRVSGRALGAQALLHNDVVSAALATGRTPLPARFGSYFVDDFSCVATLAARAPQHHDKHARLTGTVEMSVLIVPPRSPSTTGSATVPERNDPAAGRRYLEVVRERARLADAARRTLDSVVEDISDAVRDLVRAEKSTRRSAGIVSLAHLLPREAVTGFRQAVRGVATPKDVRLIIAGPRAPYSFVETGVLSTGHDSGSPDVNA